jgi:anthranilate synthase component 2
METKKPCVVVIDHFDSFTYNLVVAFENLGARTEVFRTNADIADVRRAEPTHIVLSPGPGHPSDVPLFQKVLMDGKAHLPILGGCLGHQAIGLHFGAKVVRNPTPMHGKTSEVEHTHLSIFRGVLNPFTACRYHSLTVWNQTIDYKRLEPLAFTKDDGTVMAVRSKDYPHVVGVQFHPESLFTEDGSILLNNFLQLEVKNKPAIPHGFGQTPRS